MNRITSLITLAFLTIGSSIIYAAPKICLTMVVADDEIFLRRCLDSVKNVVDYVSICDLGSTDHTIRVIEEFMDQHQIPGTIHHREWKNFGKNKTEAAQAAQQALKDAGHRLEDWYLLAIEPEMILKEGVGFKKDALTADCYMILEKSAALSYHQYDVHFLRASIQWKSQGVTHEFWSSVHPTHCEKLTTLMVEDKSDEGRLKERLALDLELLNKELEEKPNQKRYKFFLAQTYQGLKIYDEAIAAYVNHLNECSDSAEICLDKFMIGECYEAKGDWDLALSWYLEAYQCNPDRVEALRRIATYYRNQSKHDIALIFAKYGSRIPIPDQSYIFHDPEFSPFRFEEEVSIAAYYTRFKEDGFDGVNQLLLRKNLPWYVKDYSLRNTLFYVQPLQNAQFVTIKLELPLIRKDYEDRYNPMNPSILRTDKGYQVICRTVNYTQTGAKIFNTIDEQGIFRTRNFLLNYDKQFNLLSQHEIIENLPREHIRTFSLEGLDDCRLFEYHNSLWFTCTTGDTNPYGNFQISLCKLGNPQTNKKVYVESLLPLLGPDPYRCEKNWLPFIKDETLYLIYGYEPFQVFKPNLKTGEYEIACEYSSNHDFTAFRGSAPPIPFDQGYLMVSHEVVLREDYTRCYLHRFAYLDSHFTLQKVSKPFTFLHQGIEFCCGMTSDHQNSNMILSVGIEDREAYLCIINMDTIRSLLEPLPPLVVDPAFKPK